METPKIDRMPPPTIEFRRLVNGITEAQIACQDCGASKIVPLAELGLPDTTPFPPEGSVGTCGACGSDHVTAAPVWPIKQESQTEAPNNV